MSSPGETTKRLCLPSNFGLPFAAILDSKQLQRFRNEALAAAQLHHPHIVPVYGVGCERGVHFYAMQFVEGENLARVVRELRGQGEGEGPKSPISSHRSNRDPAYIRLAVELGIQAAEALDHAHQLGVVHRDVKPGKLLVDAAGELWVTDFGLARSRVETGLTVTGELLGTVGYMSPEQTQAKRPPLDHRTDVYSLGVTLYELLTPDRAFPGNDPQEVVRDIAVREPVAPRRLHPMLPLDVETVILKSMSKDPAARYATAQEMADDLARCRDGMPIVARRRSLGSHAAKWARRHRGLVAASIVVLLLGFVALGVDAWRVGRALEQSESHLRLVRDAVDKFLVEVGASETREAPLPPLARRELLEAALAFYEQHRDDLPAYANRHKLLHAMHRYDDAIELYDRALRRWPAHPGLLTGRGHMLWHVGRFEESLADLDAAIASGGDDRAMSLRCGPLRSLGRFDEALAAADHSIAADARSAEPWVERGSALVSLGRLDESLAAYDRAAELDPSLAGPHQGRACTLMALGRAAEALAACDRAIELDPGYAQSHMNRGTVLTALGRHEESAAAWAAAVRLEPNDGSARFGLGCALDEAGDSEGAMREYREAIRLEDGFAKAHCNLGLLLARHGDFEEAVSWLRNGDELGSRRPGWAYPSKSWLAAAESNAAILRRLESVLAGESFPRDAAERIQFAEFLAFKERHGEAARMYAAAFDEDPSLAADLVEAHRYRAACQACLAGDSGVTDADDWLVRAIEWLREDLSARATASTELSHDLDHWKKASDLAIVRDRVAELSDELRASAVQLWSEVDSARAGAAAAAKREGE